MLTIRDLSLNAVDGRPGMAEISLQLAAGGNLVVTGGGGQVRNRLLKVIAGTERPATGLVCIGGVEVWPGKGAFALAGKVKVGLAFGRGGLLANLSLRDNVALPLRFLGLPQSQVAARVTAALEAFGLASVAGLRPHAISEAARKHGNLARILALEPDLLLLDEPLGGLEAADRSLTMELIQARAADVRCTLVIAAEEGSAYDAIKAEHLPISAMSFAGEPS